MIANPKLRAFKYDPYAKKLTEEFYDHERMLKTRQEAIQRAIKTDKYALVLSTLGRQGSPNVLRTLQNRIEALGKKNVVILLSEIFPDKIKLFKNVDAFIQVRSLMRKMHYCKSYCLKIFTPSPLLFINIIIFNLRSYRKTKLKNIYIYLKEIDNFKSYEEIYEEKKRKYLIELILFNT